MTTKSDQKKYDQIVSELKKLRHLFEREEIKFYLRLQEVEKTESKLILAVNGSFSRFLEDIGLADAGRYESFCNGLTYTSKEDALVIGTNMVIALAKTIRKDCAPVAIQFAKDNVEKRGVMPSMKLATEFMISSRARDKIPKATQEKSVIAELQAQLQKAKADLRSEQAKNKKLLQEITELKKRLTEKAA